MSAPDPRWSEAWSLARFRVQAIATALALPAAVATLSSFLLWVEERPGAVLDDPLLAALEPADGSAPAFTLIYGGLLLALALLARHPLHLLRAVQAYVFLLLLRMACMWATPLDPPAGFVPLSDPVVESFGPAAALSRDLFFSGHTATLFLLGLAVPQRGARILLWIACTAVAWLLLQQHAHYTVDVLVAPLAATTAFALARLLPRCGDRGSRAEAAAPGAGQVHDATEG